MRANEPFKKCQFQSLCVKYWHICKQNLATSNACITYTMCLKRSSITSSCFYKIMSKIQVTLPYFQYDLKVHDKKEPHAYLSKYKFLLSSSSNVIAIYKARFFS